MDAPANSKHEMRNFSPNSDSRLHFGDVYQGNSYLSAGHAFARTSSEITRVHQLVGYMESAHPRSPTLPAAMPHPACASADKRGSPGDDLERYRTNDLRHCNFSCRPHHAIEVMTGDEKCLGSDIEAHKDLSPGWKEHDAALARQPDSSSIVRFQHQTVRRYLTGHKSTRERLRIACKTTILVAAPLCFHVMRNYGVSRGLLLSASSQLSRTADSCHTQTTYLPEPQWLACPDPLLFLAASMGAGVLLARYHQLNKEDKFQNWVLLTLTFSGLAFSFCSGLTFLATNLTVTPWAVFLSLILSDLVHLCIQRFGSAHSVDVLDGEQGCEFVEKP